MLKSPAQVDMHPFYRLRAGETAWVLGCMSGTSMDGIDLALLETDGEGIRQFGPASLFPYNEEVRHAVRQAMQEAVAMQTAGDKAASLSLAEELVTQAHIEALRQFMTSEDVRPLRDQIAVVGFHGQTVFHAPQRGFTVQLGDGSALAHALGLPVVYDFRSQDVACGGQGAPLVPVFHRALAYHVRAELPVAFLNLGGVANVTFVNDGPILLAGDIGPANSLMDDEMHQRTGLAFDAGGQLAANGRADQARVEVWLRHPFFQAPFPKSLDRQAFADCKVEDLSLEDALATLALFTVRCVDHSLSMMPWAPSHLYVAGGGAMNAHVMTLLRSVLKSTRVVAVDDIGLRSDALEAQAFAYLAARSLRGLALTYPETTGVKYALCGGRLAVPLSYYLV